MPERFTPPGAHYWKARMVKGGVYIGVMTWLGPPYLEGEEIDRSPRHQALVRNETSGRAILMGDYVPIEVDGAFLRNLVRIDRDEYLYLVEHAAYSTQHAPHNADASPTTTIDFNSMKPPF